MRSYVCTRDIHKRVMFANYIFANITSFAKFAKISSRENFQVHGICQDGGAVGFVDFTKLLFALSSLVQPLKRVISIPEHFFVILSQRKACAGRFREETAGKNRSDNKMAATDASVHPVSNRLFTISPFTKRTKVAQKVFQKGLCCL